MIDNVVLGFINDFKSHSANGTNIAFESEYSYYFAMMLKARFFEYPSSIYYNKSEKRFAFFIDKHLYNITGDISGKFEAYIDFDLYKVEDPVEYLHAVNDSIRKYNLSVNTTYKAPSDQQLLVLNQNKADTCTKHLPGLFDSEKLPF